MECNITSGLPRLWLAMTEIVKFFKYIPNTCEFSKRIIAQRVTVLGNLLALGRYYKFNA